MELAVNSYNDQYCCQFVEKLEHFTHLVAYAPVPLDIKESLSNILTIPTSRFHLLE